ncbi:MAG: hypothetical protein CVU41_10935 [Chloroflexi bacterium HGW-Chloroflexi-3]|nr:MAG: hypothetical protein CVU41_10935 [Chloroflexi bacterium HGW-Chloroflexi-3]
MNSNDLDRNKQKKLFFNIIIFTLIFFMAVRVPLDSDFWWHVRSGQLSLMNGSPILEDLTTFTVFNSSWVNHSWLSQIFYFFILSSLGNIGIMISVAIIATLSIFFVFIRLKTNPIINGFTILLCVMTTAVVWSPRPQLLTLLFFSILTYLLTEKSVFSEKIPTILVPILFLIWGNLHAGFSIGIILIITIFVGKALDFLLYKEESNQDQYKTLIFWFLLIVVCSLIVMINPNGIGIWQVQFNTITLPSLQNLIPEWASPNFHELYQQPFLWLWLLLVFFFMANRTSYKFSTIIPLLVLGGLGFISRRNYVYYAIFSIPLLSKEMQRFFEIYLKNYFSVQKFFNNIKNLNKKSDKKISKYINLFFVGFLWFMVTWKIIYLGSPIIFDFYEKKSFPKEAITAIENKELTDFRCFNSYTWGGYISWKLPEMKIFIDGRTDLYGEILIQDWIEMVNGGEAWKQKFGLYDINCVFLEEDRPIINLLEDNGWHVVYSDELSVIMTNQNH